MLRPNFAEYLRKIDDLNGGELRIINQYEVGEGLGLNSKQTDEIVDQLRDASMIKKITRNKIVLSPQALYAIHKTEKSE
jgi:Mn-dependent DtxR family transcriptional regulator